MAVTMRELAKLAGVSTATISLALRDHPRIRAGVRDRVKALATEVGYRPNPVVSQLITQVRASKTTTYQSTLGAILTGDARMYRDVHTFRDWLASCKTRAIELGYGFDVFRLQDVDLSPERLLKILDARKIQGLVVAGPFHGSESLSAFQSTWERSAVVMLGERPNHPMFSCVLNNQFSTSITAFDELIRLGYQRPALCMNPDLDKILEDRFLGGFLVRQTRLPTRQRIPPFDFSSDSKTRFKQWMKRYRPDAILTLHYEIKEWLEEAGVAIPHEVALAHLDRAPDMEDWAGTDQNNTQIGSVAINMLTGQLNRNEVGTQAFQKCMFINSTWKNGSTVHPES
jgi:LacI family transcriptional regulator